MERNDQSREHLIHHSSCGCGHDAGGPVVLSRRGLLTGAAALGAIGVAGVGIGGRSIAQSSAHRIDVHHHVTPPVWLAELKKAKKDNPPLANWSVQRSLDDMDKAGIATSLTSPTTPQVGFLDKDTAAKVSRESNEWAKKLEGDHKGRLGTFAMLPLPYVDESLKAIEYAFDTLKVDGVGIMTSYGDKWLGDKHFDPVWAELNRRKATVYTHPTGANCCLNIQPEIPDSAIEYGTDTTRSLAQLIFTGRAKTYADIKWIWSHGGGALTAFAERFLIQMPNSVYKDKFSRDDVQGHLNSFYYDTAQVSGAGTLQALAKLVPVSQIVYGTDYPYRTGLDHTKGAQSAFSGADLAAVERGNALRLVPRLKA
jgi:predicted TIM-barrel fold metal-dependent hydrolase